MLGRKAGSMPAFFYELHASCWVDSYTGLLVVLDSRRAG